MGSKRTSEVTKHACNRRRSAKVRCFVDTVAEHDKCRRCYEGDKECIFEEMAPRSRRERSDTRIRLLEREVKILKARFEAALQSQEMSKGSQAGLSSREVLPNIGDSAAPIRHMPSREEEEMERRSDDHDSLVEAENIRTYMTQQQAEHLLCVFVDESLPHYPILAFETTPTLQSLEAARPILCFAMITAATRASDPALFRQLHLQLSRTLAEKIVVQGEGNLELLQALLVAEVWYDPPDDLNRLNFYHWLQMATNLAQQLGILWNSDVIDAVIDDNITNEQMQKWRIALGTYLSMSTVSISFQRHSPVQLPLAARMAVAKYSVHAKHLNDKRLAAWMTLQLMAEEIEALRTEMMGSNTTVNIFETRVADLNDRLSLYERMAVLNSTLRVHYLYVCTKLYELQFCLGGTIHRQHESLQPRSDKKYGTSYERSVMQLIRTSHNAIETVLQMPTSEYLHSPTVTTVRVLYALRTLQLLHCMHPHAQEERSSISVQTLADFEINLDRVDRFFTEVCSLLEHRVPSMATTIMKTVRAPKDHNTRDISHLSRTHNIGHGNDLDAVTSSTLAIEKGTPVIDESSSLHTTSGSNMSQRLSAAANPFDQIDMGDGRGFTSWPQTYLPFDVSFGGLFAPQDNLLDVSHF